MIPASASPAGTAAGAASMKVRARPAPDTWAQPLDHARPGASASQPGAWTWPAASHAAVIGSDQAAARYSRTGGHPRSHATRYPVTVTSVTGHAATAAAASSSQPAALTALRSSHRHAVSFSHDQTLIAAAPG